MPKQSTFALDEHGRQWLVLPGDPGWQVCNTLLRTMDFIVLPRHTIVTGEVREGDTPTNAAMLDAFLDELGELGRAVENGASPAVGSLFIRKLRLMQCVDLLTRKGADG